MNNDKVIIGFLIIINALLVVVCVFFYLKQDGTVPVLSFQDVEIVFSEGMEIDGLLSGVSAYDNRDGDITDKIVIEKTMEDAQASKIVVYYAVSDRSGNVAKAYRSFPMTSQNDKTEQEQVAIVVEEKEKVIDVKSNDVILEGAQDVISAIDKRDEEETKEDKKKDSVEDKDVYSNLAPTVSLSVSDVTVSVGSPVPWTSILSLADDKDNYAKLLNNVVLNGYDVYTLGDHVVTLYTVDSDGNQSNAVSLMVKVVE